MPNQFLMDFMVARAARNNPAFAHQLLQSQEDARALKQAQALSKVLVDAIGSNPTGSASSVLPQLPIEKVITPSSYSGPFANEINQAAQESGLSPAEIAAVARRESNFDPNAQSPTGPQGLMQLSQAAAQDVGVDPNKRFDPLTNLIGGAKYLAKMKQEFGDNAYLAYHDGPGAVRSGNISDAGRQYQEQLRQDMANQQNNAGAVASPEYTNTSKFLPNPMSGGSGLLGQDMDSVRRAYFEHLKQVAQSGTPEAIAYVMKGLEDMRNAHMQDIQRTATQKELASTNLVPGTREYSDAMLRTMMKPSTQINMGQITPQQQLLTPEQKKEKGFTANSVVGVDPKTGEYKVIQQPTEAQGKDLGRAHMQNVIDKQLEDLYNEGFNPTTPTRDVAFSPLLDIDGMLGPSAGALGRYAMDPKAIRYKQIQDTWVETFGRDASGGAIKPEEYGAWRNMYFPQQNDDEATVINKNEARKAYEKSLAIRAGTDNKSTIEENISSNVSSKPVDMSAFENYYNSLKPGDHFISPDGRPGIKR